MKEAQPIFPIEDTIVDDVQNDRNLVHFEIHREYLVSIAKEKHPELLNYLRNTVEASPKLAKGYFNGFSMMYDIILRQLSTDTRVELTREDMVVHGYNVQEHGIDRLSAGALDYWHDSSLTDESIREQTPVSTFMDRLKSSSRPMYSDIQETLGRDDVDANEKLGYFRGLYDIFMPFYNKAEAEYLQERLITYPHLKRAVASGFYNEE